jgi:hypothetical protein
MIHEETWSRKSRVRLSLKGLQIRTLDFSPIACQSITGSRFGNDTDCVKVDWALKKIVEQSYRAVRVQHTICVIFMQNKKSITSYE